MIKKGDEITADISDLNSEGKGVSRLPDGFVIFSENTVPGDKALLKIKRKKSNYAEAALVKIESPSQDRVNPRCIHFGICGGCKMQNLDYGRQIRYKSDVVKDAMERIGGFKNIFIPDAVKSDNIYYYRNKMEFSFSDDEWKESVTEVKDEDNFALGLHVPKFHSKIVDLKECHLQSEITSEILNFTRAFFKERKVTAYSSFKQSGFLRFLIFRKTSATNELLVNLITYDYNEPLIKEYTKAVTHKFPQITDLINSTSAKLSRVAAGEKEYVLFGKGYVTEIIRSRTGREYKFLISPQSFFQTNTLQAEKLFDIVIETGDFRESDKALDLYCGTGAITLLLSGKAGFVKGVELSEESISDAIKNAKFNNVKNAEFICSDIKKYLENPENHEGFNKLVLDPPRSGLHPEISEKISETKFEKIVYVSCNPHTQARDLQIICSKGNYKISRLQPVDMFPHTYHVENVVLLDCIE